MDYKVAFHEACLLQAGIEDIYEDCGVEHDDLILLDETERCWVVKDVVYTGIHNDHEETLCVVYKDEYVPIVNVEL